MTQTQTLPWPGRTWTQPKDKRTFNGHDHRPTPVGPWLDEPDKVHWIDPATDLDCMIHRGPLGALCGYVGVPPGHPWHGVRETRDELPVQVHGGLTYGALCDEEATESSGICHVPLPGRPHEVFWLGFDCGHGFDVIPGMAVFSDSTYKDLAYVRAEVERLAAQVAAAA